MIEINRKFRLKEGKTLDDVGRWVFIDEEYDIFVNKHGQILAVTQYHSGEGGLEWEVYDVTEYFEVIGD